jgi:hypothetical protein
MQLQILASAHHRNGRSGDPFDVVLFREAGGSSRKLGILFEELYHSAVLDLDALVQGHIALPSNPRQDDAYEAHLRQVVAATRTEADSSRTGTTGEPTIAQRVRRIAHVLTWCGPDARLENLIDVLADARHWCDRNQLSFAELDRQAYQHYLTERDAINKE